MIANVRTKSNSPGAIKNNVTKLYLRKTPLYQSVKQKKTAQGIQIAGIILEDSGAGDVETGELLTLSMKMPLQVPSGKM